MVLYVFVITVAEKVSVCHSVRNDSDLALCET